MTLEKRSASSEDTLLLPMRSVSDIRRSILKLLALLPKAGR
jgi:hypothetical protein